LKEYGVMDEEIIIDELDFLFLELGSELWALEVHLNALEEQIVFWQEQNPIGILPEKAKGLTEDDEEWIQSELQQHQAEVKYALPRLLRSSFIVVLWAVYEAAVKELAEYLRRKGDLKMSDLSGGSTQQSTTYFEHILCTALYSSNEVRERLGRLQAVRHAIAHANGRLTEIKPGNRKTLNRWIKEDRGITEEHGCLMLSEAFVRQGYADVEREIQRLIAIAKSKGAGSKSDELNRPSDDARR
jgi:hypothetical protein